MSYLVTTYYFPSSNTIDMILYVQFDHVLRVNRL